MDVNRPNPLSFSFFPIYMRGGIVHFPLSTWLLVSPHYLFPGSYCLCHLTSCLISDARRLNSDTKLICDDIPEVLSTNIKRVDAVIYLAPFTLVYNLRMTYLIKESSLDMDKAAPWRSGRSMIILFAGVSFLGYFHFEISQVWVCLFEVRSHGVCGLPRRQPA